MTVMMKGLKRPLVSYPVTGIGPPFDVHQVLSPGMEEGPEIRLPFLYWNIKDKKIGEKAFLGETLRMNSEIITAVMHPPLPEMSNIKLVFQFCTDAHCFGDIYGKVVSVNTTDGETGIHQLRITSIGQEDRRILNGWMDSASD
jgi:adenylate cyclase